jgi:hypothetical protein
MRNACGVSVKKHLEERRYFIDLNKKLKEILRKKCERIET